MASALVAIRQNDNLYDRSYRVDRSLPLQKWQSVSRVFAQRLSKNVNTRAFNLFPVYRECQYSKKQSLACRFSPVVWLHVLNRLEDLPKPPFPVCYVNCSIDHVQIEVIKTRKRSDKKNTEEQSRHAFHSVNVDLSVRSDATVRF